MLHILKNLLCIQNLAKNVWNVFQRRIQNNCKLSTIVMNNGHEMPMLGFGTWNENSEKVTEAIGWAIDAGYRHIDCAHLHRNQHEIGKVLKKKFESKALARENIFITSKLWNTFHNPEHVCSACKQTLEDLDIDYLDMYLMNSPMGFQYSNDFFPLCQSKLLISDVDYIDTWIAMEELVDTKMCKSIGISNFNETQIKRLLKICKIIPQTLQIELHPYLTQKNLINFVKSHDICITALFPFGLPNNSWTKPGGEIPLLANYKIKQLAQKHKRTEAQILLRYQIQGGHAVIPQSTEQKQINENIAIFDFELCPEDVQNIDSLNQNLRYFDFMRFVLKHISIITGKFFFEITKSFLHLLPTGEYDNLVPQLLTLLKRTQ